MELIETLGQIQKANRLNDSQMAERLGCTRQLYQMTRTGKATIGLTILKGAVRAFPEVIGDAIFFLTNGADIRTGMPDTSTSPSQNAQDGKLGRFRGRCRGFIKSLIRRI